MKQMRTSRRSFLEAGMAAVAVSACGGCSLFGSRKPDVVAQNVEGEVRLDEADSAKLLASEASLLVQPGDAGEKILVVNTGDGKLSAVSAVCTHMGCNVNYDPELGRIVCPCHKSQFGLDGSNIEGPAKLPLRSYSTRTENGRVVIAL